VARYGGEEFVLLLPMTPRRGAEHMARHILDAVEALGIPHETSLTSVHVTVSIGIACFDESSAGWTGHSADLRAREEPGTQYSASDLLQAADTALYTAKNAGRARAKLCDIADLVPVPSARYIVAPPQVPSSG
jgi:PleD family two-component response regulator